MSDFETEATLSLVVQERELQQARQTIEDGIGDVEVGVAGDGGGGGRPPEMQTDGGSSRQQRRNRREHRWARSRTNDVEDILELLERADLGGGDGGGLAGGLLDFGGSLGGALAGAIPAGIGAAVGSAVGPVIAQELSDAEVSVGELGEEPEWVPIQVDEPDWSIDVEEPDDGLDEDLFPSLDDLPTLGIPDIDPLSVREPTLDVDSPDSIPLSHPETIAVDDPSPLAVSDTHLPLEVEEVGEIPVEEPSEIPVEDVGPIEVVVSVPDTAPRSDDSARTSTDSGTINEDDAFQRGIRRVPFVGGLLGDADAQLRGMDTVGPTFNDPERRDHFNEGTTTEHSPDTTAPVSGDLGPAGSQSEPDTHSVTATSIEPAQVETEVSPRIEINVDTDRMVREILDGFDDAMDDVRRDLEDDIEDVADDLDDLERDIRNG